MTARGRRSGGGAVCADDKQGLNLVRLAGAGASAGHPRAAPPAYLGRNVLLSLLPHRIAYLIRISGTKCQQRFITSALIARAGTRISRLGGEGVPVLPSQGI